MKRAGWLIFLMIIMMCCTENSEIGIDFFDSHEVEVVYVDTLTVKASTVLFDSLVPNSPVRLIAGHHVDDKLGDLTVKTFFQLYPTYQADFDNDIRYSRMTLELYSDGYAYYDTANYVTLSVHRLMEELTTTDQYSTSSYAYDPQSLGELTFLPKPNRTDTTLEVQLSDELGTEFFELIKGSSGIMTSTEDFLEYFKGLVIVPDVEANGPILGFSTTPVVKLYYYDESTIPITEGCVQFSASGGLKFNQIKSDRNSTQLSGLNSTTPTLNSDESDNQVFMQGGTGIRIRVQIPYLKDILLSNSNMILASATLQMFPSKGSFGQNAYLPSTLQGLGYNFSNDIYFSTVETEGSLVEDFDLGRDTHYEIDVSDFVHQQLQAGYAADNALIFNFYDDIYRSSVERIYMEGSTGDKKMKLILRYVIVNE